MSTVESRAVERLVRDGRALYLSATSSKCTHPPSVKMGKLRAAAADWNLALGMAKLASNVASLHKQIACAHAHMARLQPDKAVTTAGRNEAERSIKYHTSQACVGFARALSMGMATCTPAWVASVRDKFEDVLNASAAKVDGLHNLDRSARSGVFANAINELQNDRQTCRNPWALACSYRLQASDFHNTAIVLREHLVCADCGGICRAKGLECIQATANAEMSRSFACRLSRDCDGLTGVVIREELEQLRESVAVLGCTVRATLCIADADEALRVQMEDVDTPDQDVLSKIADLYREAAKLTHKDSDLDNPTLDIETEAIATSRLAHMFDKVWRVDLKKALRMYRECIALGMSLRPRDVSQEDWYVKATERARLIEQAVQARNDAKWQELRGPSMEKLKPELDKMETENAKGARELLTFLYKNHFPKAAKDYKLPETISADEFSGCLRQAAIHFHPDKVKVDTDGIDAKVFAEEASKLINARWQRSKG